MRIIHQDKLVRTGSIRLEKENREENLGGRRRKKCVRTEWGDERSQKHLVKMCGL